MRLSRADRSIVSDWWFTIDRQLVAAVYVLLMTGLVLSLAASPAIALRLGLGTYHFVERHVVFLALAALLMLMTSLLQPGQIRRVSFVLLVAMALLMVLVLALPQEFPHRDLVVAMTFGVVILSILVQGLTMGPLLRRLKLVGISEGRAEYDRLKGALSAVNAALVEVEKMEIERGIPKVVTDEVRAHYARRADEYEEAVADLHLKAERLLEEDRLRAARRALIAEKDALVTAYKSGQIAEESYEHLVADVDARLFELEAGESDGH